MTSEQALRSYVESHYPIIYLVTFEEENADRVISSLAVEGRKIFEWNMARGMVRFDTKALLVDHMDLPSALENWLDQELDNHFLVIKDAHLGLRDNPLAMARLKALANKIVHDDATLATVFLVSSQPYIPQELEKLITLFDLPLPDEAGIAQIIRDHAAAYGDIVVDKTVNDLALAFRGLSQHEIHQLLNRGLQQDGHIGSDDVELVLAEKQQIIKKSGILEMVPVSGQLEDIGGLEKLKAWLKQKAAVLAALPAARAFGVEPPKGMMIVGMPGCGKSLTAKAASALFRLPLLRLDIGSLMGKFVGDSESNMRRALKLAEAISPCVLWVDELEKAFAGMGGGGGGSEVSTRLFGYFLTWMQEKTGAVFVLATANDISALPPELLRKGRFDEIFYVDFPTEAERAAIFEVHLRKRNKLSPKIDVKQLAKKTTGFSGADVECVVKDAIEQAFIDDKANMTTERLISAAESTHPLSEVMKDRIEEFAAKFSKMRIRSAS
jgi:ATP-dependent 26S proteasome regulatory subunit